MIFNSLPSPRKPLGNRDHFHSYKISVSLYLFTDALDNWRGKSHHNQRCGESKLLCTQRCAGRELASNQRCTERKRMDPWPHESTATLYGEVDTHSKIKVNYMWGRLGHPIKVFHNSWHRISRHINTTMHLSMFICQNEYFMLFLPCCVKHISRTEMDKMCLLYHVCIIFMLLMG